MKNAAVVVGGAIVVVAVAVGLYVGGWWITNDVTNRQAHVDRLNNGSQLTYRNEIHRKIADINGVSVQISAPSTPADEKAALTAQRAAMVAATCDIAVNAVDLPTDEAAWVSANCN
jgi:uncharacterized ferritin-like protein (DUF455 family)